MADLLNQDKMREHYLFKYLSSDEYSQIINSSFKKNVSKGEIIWSRTEIIDFIIVILKGRLKITLMDRIGNEFAIKHIVPIDSLGDATIVDNKGQMADVVAVEDSLLLYVPKKEIVNILQKNRKAAFSLCSELSCRINNLTRELELQVFSRCKLKILYKLLQLKKDDSFEINITHQLLAELVGMSREKLTLALDEIEDSGLIKKTRGKIVIRDFNGMIREVEESILGN
jgi:CRP/FNR family transcriptional regulator